MRYRLGFTKWRKYISTYKTYWHYDKWQPVQYSNTDTRQRNTLNHSVSQAYMHSSYLSYSICITGWTVATKSHEITIHIVQTHQTLRGVQNIIYNLEMYS